MRRAPLAVAALLMGVLLALAPTPADAASRATWHWKTSPISSFGYSYGGINISVPTGCFLTLGVKYNEKTAGIQTVKAGTDCIGLMAMNPWWFCNSKMQWRFYDTEGRRYYTWTTRTNTRCRTSLLWVMPQSVVGKYGKVCARFYVAGTKRKTVCKSIHS
jgi:hypothetical protein